MDFLAHRVQGNSTKSAFMSDVMDAIEDAIVAFDKARVTMHDSRDTGINGQPTITRFVDMRVYAIAAHSSTRRVGTLLC